MTLYDKKEINNFSKLSNNWMNPEGPMKLLHVINPIRLEFIIDILTNNIARYQNIDNSEISILDVGCGAGIATIPLARLGFQIKGIDASKSNIENANLFIQKNNIHNVTFEHDAELQQDCKFDVILCLEVLEHVPNPANFIKRLKTLLKPNGLLILSTINRTLISYLGAIVAAEAILKWVPNNTHKFSKFVKPEELFEILEKEKIETISIKGISFNPIKNSWNLSKNLQINYIMAAKLIA